MTEKGVSLYDFDAQFKALDDLLEVSGGDLSQEINGKSVEEWIEKNEILHRDKVGAYCAIIKRLELDAEACKTMSKGYTDRAKVKLNKIERLKDALFQSMELRKIVKIDAPTNLVWIQKNGGKAPVVIRATVDELPEVYKKTIPAQVVIDSEKLMEDARNGVPEALKFCDVGDTGSSLRIK